MRRFVGIILLLVVLGAKTSGSRKLFHDKKEVKTTYEVPSKFYGKYKGAKKGYLLLKEDGTGEYMYDYDGFRPENCPGGAIQIKWGFLLDDEDKIVAFDREYGKSYPILYNVTGETSFKGCSQRFLVDYILEYKNGDIEISSSDDWKKN